MQKISLIMLKSSLWINGTQTSVAGVYKHLVILRHVMIMLIVLWYISRLVNLSRGALDFDPLD